MWITCACIALSSSVRSMICKQQELDFHTMTSLIKWFLCSKLRREEIRFFQSQSEKVRVLLHFAPLVPFNVMYTVQIKALGRQNKMVGLKELQKAEGQTGILAHFFFHFLTLSLSHRRLQAQDHKKCQSVQVKNWAKRQRLNEFVLQLRPVVLRSNAISLFCVLQ